jgi:hypothetical protein
VIASSFLNFRHCFFSLSGFLVAVGPSGLPLGDSTAER